MFLVAPGTKEKTIGILELGGASTQIAFIPPGNVLANKFSLRLVGRRYPLYVHSYLYFGQEYVDKSIKSRLMESNHTRRRLRNVMSQVQQVVENPCMLKGEHFFQTSEFYSALGCMKQAQTYHKINDLLNK